MAVMGGSIARFSNAQISDMIGQRLPIHVFTSVKTYAEIHHFADGSGALHARKVVLIRTELSLVWEAVKDFFYSLFGLAIEPVNGAQFENAVARGSDLAEDRRAVEHAVARCKIIELYISEDGEHVDSSFKDSNLMVIARQVGTVLRPRLWHLLG